MAKHSYPTQAAIRRAIEAVRATGLDVAGFEIGKDGQVRILDRSAIQASPTPSNDLFAELEAKGLI